MAKINKLTTEQQSRLVEWHREWFAVGSSCEPADRPRAEAAITAMYTVIGEQSPHFVWCDSPATAILAQAILREAAKPGSSLESSLWSSLESSLRSSLRSSLESSLWSSLESSLRSSLRSSLESSLWSLRFWGSNEAYWVAFYAFCRDVVGVPYDAEKSQHLDLWCEVARSAYWWWPFRGLCFVSERPAEIYWEGDREQPRLHNTTGPALRFRDGLDVHCVRGVMLSREIGRAMAANTLTAKQILDERNAEARRVLVAQYNAGDSGRWARDLGAAPIHSDVDLMGRPRRLYRIEQEGDEPFMLIEVTNSTPELEGELAGKSKAYCFRVHPELRPHADRGARHRDPKPQELTCQNAIASGYGFYGHEYQPILET